MFTLSRFLAFFFFLLSYGEVVGAAEMTSGQLAQHCLPTCSFLRGGGMMPDEQVSSDTCAGYVKAIVSSARAFPPESEITEVQTCGSKLLARRTASSPSEDGLLISLCQLGEWISARPSLQHRPASQGVIQWIGATSCSE